MVDREVYKHLLCIDPKNIHINEDMKDTRPQWIFIKSKGTISDQMWCNVKKFRGRHVALLETGELVYYRDCKDVQGSVPWYFGAGDCTIGKGVYHHSERF